MQNTSFKIYNASAGAGKTFTLTKEYLKIILSSPKSYKQILAITFTNKAVNEMKSRILGSLYEFSKTASFDGASAMFKNILEELQIDAPTLQQKAKTTLKNILHNYAFFDISTIDKFTHRLIRTFAKDLKLPQNFEVVLDNDLLLGEAVARAINKAGTDEKITKVLIDFALEKIDGNKSWDIAFDLNAIGKLLFYENHATHLQKLLDKDIDAFLKLKKSLRDQIDISEKKAIGIASKVLSLIANQRFEWTDFPRETLPNHFKRIINSEFDPSKLYNNKLEENLRDGKILKSGIAKSTETIAPEILKYYQAIKTLLYHRALLNNAYFNIVPLTVLNAIQQEVKTLQQERDQLSISEFNTIISNEIKNQPAPFIYERLGEKYRHYFIDEFQDTSVMQWNNLIPLISNALEGQDEQGNKGSLFLVGDIKQAIYRWRGGKAEQFLSLVNQATNPFVVSPQIENLPMNYRSHEEIIKFNNAFFTSTSPLLNNKIYQTIFEEGNKQGANAKEGGIVKITLLDSDNEKNQDQIYCEEVLLTITELLEKNYKLQDIAILTRDNKHGILLADFLTHQGIPIISPDSLLISSSRKVKFLIDLLTFVNQPHDLETSYSILSFLAQGIELKHQFITKRLLSLNSFLEESYSLEIEMLKRSSVYDGLEYAIKQFQLAEGSDAYIIHFMDTVFEVEQKEGTDIQTFLSYWEKKKGKLSITAPENVDAVQIMSVHKAKGLEFSIVIFPFANSHIYKRNDKKLWIPVNSEDYCGFEELLVSEKKEVSEYGKIPELLFKNEEHQMELDAFNVLYVALTRAIKGLFIISERDLNKIGAHNTNYYSGLFIQYLKDKGIWDENKNTYNFGHLNNILQVETGNAQENITYQYSFKERPGFRILAKSGKLWDTEREEAIFKGNLIHYIMSLIETEKDLPNALDTLLQNGDIADDELNYVRKMVNQIINHPELHTYYKEGSIVFNERDIITNEGKVLRPDRVVIKNNMAALIDYKSGKRNPAHTEQLFTYADAVKSMGYGISKKIIVYIDNTITPEFI